MKTITLTLPYPISANLYWRTRVAGKIAMTYVSNEAKAYKADVSKACKVAGIVAPIIGRVQIDVQLFPHRPLDWQKRQRVQGAMWDDSVQCIDLDNANKVLLDALKNLAIEDDKFVRVLRSERMEPDEQGKRVVVRITALAVEQPQVSMFAEMA